MKWERALKYLIISSALFVLSGFIYKTGSHKTELKFPYKKMGLTDRQAAAHLLSRFTFGATPGQVDEVVNMGIEKWFEQQLEGNLPDEEVAKRLKEFDALTMSDEQVVNTYPNPGQLMAIAKRNNINLQKDNSFSRKEYREQISAFMQKEGYKPVSDLERQLINQKVIRAAYSNNQLQEVLTDFWFNHFNVSLTKPQCVQYILPYERDAIRPNVLGNFGRLLLATAKHPAMLEYLDNAGSVSNDNPLAQRQMNSPAAKKYQERMEAMANDTSKPEAQFAKQFLNGKKIQGLNENYAREVMELHTLGVDGGYTQTDVTQVARALTGWSLMPLFKNGPTQNLVEKVGIDKLRERGFLIDGDFLYRADKHDEGTKTILGKKFSANGGYEEGVKVLEMLANHPSTAKFICKKLATRFVSDTPSATLINNMAAVFLQTKGNIKSVLVAMVNSPGFWSADALRDKVKSPFELAISSVRATHADVQLPFQLFLWCNRMGQKFYYYQAPTGFPDKASYWINTGSLLNRMNFGLAFAAEKIPGVTLNLAALNNNHEPESIDAALVIYSNLLLPERNNEQNIKRLTQLIHDTDIDKKISDAAGKNAVAGATTNQESNDERMMNNKRNIRKEEKSERVALNRKNNKPLAVAYTQGNNAMIAQVAGVIIGSPEFQRK